MTERERLTERDEFGNADIIGVSSADIQLNLNFAEFNRVTNALNKLADYEDAEETGTLVRLPCRVGTRVYEIVDNCTYGDDCYTKRMCKTCDFRDLYMEIKTLNRISEIVSRLSSFGKTVFLTREDAEKALKERDGK